MHWAALLWPLPRPEMLRPMVFGDVSALRNLPKLVATAHGTQWAEQIRFPSTSRNRFVPRLNVTNSGRWWNSDLVTLRRIHDSFRKRTATAHSIQVNCC